MNGTTFIGFYQTRWRCSVPLGTFNMRTKLLHPQSYVNPTVLLNFWSTDFLLHWCPHLWLESSCPIVILLQEILLFCHLCPDDLFGRFLLIEDKGYQVSCSVCWCQPNWRRYDYKIADLFQLSLHTWPRRGYTEVHGSFLWGSVEARAFSSNICVSLNIWPPDVDEGGYCWLIRPGQARDTFHQLGNRTKSFQWDFDPPSCPSLPQGHLHQNAPIFESPSCWRYADISLRLVHVALCSSPDKSIDNARQSCVTLQDLCGYLSTVSLLPI